MSLIEDVSYLKEKSSKKLKEVKVKDKVNDKDKDNYIEFNKNNLIKYLDDKENSCNNIVEKNFFKKFDVGLNTENKEEIKSKEIRFISDNYFSLSNPYNYISTENNFKENNELDKILENSKQEESNRIINNKPDQKEIVEIMTFADLDEISFSQGTKDYNENPRVDMSSIINFNENSLRIEISKNNIRAKYNEFMDKFFPNNISIFFKYKSITKEKVEKSKIPIKKVLHKISSEFRQYLNKYHKKNKSLKSNINKIKNNSFSSNSNNSNLDNSDNSNLSGNNSANASLSQSDLKNMKNEDYYKKIPKLYSEYVTLDYQSSELLNEIFDIYEKFVLDLTSKKVSDRGSCVPISKLTPKRQNENETCKDLLIFIKSYLADSFKEYVFGICNQRNPKGLNREGGNKNTINALIKDNNKNNPENKSKVKFLLNNANKDNLVSVLKKNTNNTNNSNNTINKSSLPINNENEKIPEEKKEEKINKKNEKKPKNDKEEGCLIF